MPTTSTTIAKAKLVHPDFGYDGGSTLHGIIRTLYTTVGNQINLFWSGSNVVANTGTLTITHNLSTALTSLVVRIFESGVPISLSAQASYTIAQTSTDVITVQNNTGSSKTVEVYILPLFYVGSANLDTAFNATLATLTGTQTLTNKTLTSPSITTPTGIVKGDVGLGNVDNTSDVTKNSAAVALTNKTIGSTNTLTGATATGFTNGGTITLPTGTLTLATLSGTEVLTNKDYNGGTASNTSRFTLPKDTFTNISALTRKQGTVLYASDQDALYYDNGTSLSPIGGNWSVAAAQTPAAAGTVTISLTVGLQEVPVSGSGGAVTLSTTPFGTSAPANGTKVILLGTSNTNTVRVNHNDSAKGFILNGDCTLYKGSKIELDYNTTLDRWLESSRMVTAIA